MNYIAMNLTKLQLIHCFSSRMAKKGSCMYIWVDPLSSCRELLLWGVPQTWPTTTLKPPVGGGHTWWDQPMWTTGERSQLALLALDLCLTQQRMLWKRTQPRGTIQPDSEYDKGSFRTTFPAGGSAQPWLQDRLTWGTYTVSAVRSPAQPD